MGELFEMSHKLKVLLKLSRTNLFIQPKFIPAGTFVCFETANIELIYEISRDLWPRSNVNTHKFFQFYLKFELIKFDCYKLKL